MTEATEKRRVSLLGTAGPNPEASEAAAGSSMTSVMASYSANSSSGGVSTTPSRTTSITVTSAGPTGGKTPFIANADSRSVSVASVSSEGSNGSAHVSAKDPESAGGGSGTGSGSGNERSAEMISLTRDIKEFKEAMRKLRRVFNPDAEPTETKRVACHERLGEVLAILRTMLENYPLLQSNHLVQSARHLISQVKDIGVLEDEVDEAEFHRALESLAWAFTQRVSQYLSAGEGNAALANDPEGRERLENYHFQDFGLGELPPHTSPHFFRGPGGAGGGGGIDELMTTDQIDNILMRQSQGVDYALKCAKNWEKYAKDLMNYVEKRIKLEVDWARNLTLLAQTMRPILKEESYLPFQSIYCIALDNDLEMCAATQETSRFLKGYRFLEPLSTRRSEHQKQRKILKDRWSKELKLMHDSASNLRKAQALYIERNRDYERCREAARIAEQGAELGATGENKVDKRKRLADEALAKTVESENYCKQCVIEANERHRQLLVVKREVLAKIRELILQCDQTMKSVTVSYFQLQHTLTSPVPTQFETLREQSRLYEPGTQFMEYVRTTLGDLPSSPRLTTSDPFNFEPEDHAPLYFDNSRSAHHQMPRKSSATNDTTDGDYGSGTYKWRGDKSSRNAGSDGHMPGWAPGGMGPIEPSDDTDSVDSSPGSYSKSRDTSPSASPMVPSRRLPHGVASAEDIDETDLATAVSGVSISNAGSSSTPAQAQASHSGPSATSGSSGGGAVPRRVVHSVAGRTHRFRRTRAPAPAKCRECESYITPWKGVDCQECGMSVHKKCLESIALVCGHKRLPRKTVTFGVDLGQHLLEVGAHVPPIVCKCVHELDKRGTRLEGIYRKSAVKHKIDKLCQNFESAPELVELTDVSPFVISDVLKTYLRELPEPLIPSKLYNDFIKVARQYPAPPMSLDGKSEEREETGDEDQKAKEEAMIQEMCDLIRQLPRHHLRTLGFLIHHLARIARESEENNMPASNLAIVFGPALMRAPTLSDTELQNRAVELMILHATAIFGTPDSVLPKDYARYTAGINYGGGGGGSGAATGGGGGGNSSSSDIPERRSVDSNAAAKQFSDPMWMLPGHVTSTDEHGGLGVGEEYITDDDDDDVGAIPSNWLPDDSAKTKKSPLLIRTEPPPKIIRQTLKTFSGLEGVTPERLSTQDSMETSQQRLSKQSSADVGAMASSTSNNCISTSNSGPSKGGSSGGSGAGSGPRKSIPHGHESKHHQSLFAKMGKAAQKHSLDEDRLSPTAASANTSLATSTGVGGHTPLSERLSGGGGDAAASPSARDNESMLPGSVSTSSSGGSTSTVIKSSTSPGSGRSSLTIHTIGNRSASLSEEHHHSAPITSSMTSSSSSSTVAEQRRKFLAGSNMTSSEGNSTATSSHHIRSASSASSSTNVVGKMSSSLPTSIPNLDENRVKIQISAGGVTGTTSSSGQRSSTSQQRTPIVKQTSVDKTSNL